ncbi:hypothetical protein COU19_00950 [Candidatus Kaiserbacteria bacterium CG10_big_fil_rev_8_21_14_0_10_56_12]|uniref:Uncharacterized protein n=1 Tax=Candidatus Kaiserbacteria bacterium CG10_big_fil_rev_8_21_14_0_10_56_12 TaxID=1974611 RepID=A0A2H0UAC0_9BACT|nr:MAG: hypothetical protein COU19_00950 [Candidatus Kaiserbacteria bacterium CG10_big_fil_rev_8_21_14_0_10_56_12]
MKPRPSHYARAFVDSIASGTSGQAAREGLVRALAKNGDTHRLAQVVYEIEKIETQSHGGHMVQMEFAREPEKHLESTLHKQFTKDDLITIALNPSLIAGTRITLDESRELDLSLAGKMRALFTHY